MVSSFDDLLFFSELDDEFELIQMRSISGSIEAELQCYGRGIK